MGTPEASAGSNEPSDELISVVERSPVPAVLLELPSERITAANRAASDLLSDSGDEVTGRYLEEFLSDAPSGGLDLMRAGRLSGYETSRDLQRTDEQLQVWVRAVGTAVPISHALAIMLPPQGRAQTLLPPRRDGEVPLVLGTTDAALHVERITSDADELLGVTAGDVTGRSVLTLVAPRDAPTMLLGIAEAAMTGRAVTFSAHVAKAEGRGHEACQLMVLPLEPPPSVGFMVLPGDGRIPLDASQLDLHQLMHRFARTIDAAATARGTGGVARSGQPHSSLSSRELDIVGRLLAGDRVPAIAKALFLSQSTVRNHLSSVFRKFNVSSQQELIDHLRKKDGSSSGR